jgi:hypothetical protein
MNTNLKNTKRQINANKVRLSTIPELEEFENRLVKRCRELIPEVNPPYIEKFNSIFADARKRHLSPSKTFESCANLVDRKYERPANLLGSLHEVKYSWNRLIKLGELLKYDDMGFARALWTDGEWFRFCEDSIWYADYGLCERIVGFLKKLERILKLKSNNPETAIISSSINTIDGLRKTIAKSRDPLVHTQSSIIDESKMRKLWSFYLLSSVGHNIEFEFIDILNLISSTNIEILRKETRSWIRSAYKIVNDIFSDLNTISLQALTIKE